MKINAPVGIRDIAVAAAVDVTIRVDKIRADAVVRERRSIKKIMNKIKRD